jgi:hypothetical protein
VWDEVDTAELKLDWPKYFYAALWADRMTVKKTTGYSPYQLMYGSQSVIPVELDTESWYVSNWKYPMTEKELLAARIKQLAKRELDQETARSMMQRMKEANKRYFDSKANVRKEPLNNGDLVLLYESQYDNRISKKFLLQWTGPYVIKRVFRNGTYEIAQLDDSASEVVAGNRLKLFKVRQENVLGTNVRFIPVDVELFSTGLGKTENSEQNSFMIVVLDLHSELEYNRSGKTLDERSRCNATSLSLMNNERTTDIKGAEILKRDTFEFS